MTVSMYCFLSHRQPSRHPTTHRISSSISSSLTDFYPVFCSIYLQPHDPHVCACNPPYHCLSYHSFWFCLYHSHTLQCQSMSILTYVTSASENPFPPNATNHPPVAVSVSPAHPPATLSPAPPAVPASPASPTVGTASPVTPVACTCSPTPPLLHQVLFLLLLRALLQVPTLFISTVVCKWHSIYMTTAFSPFSHSAGTNLGKKDGWQALLQDRPVQNLHLGPREPQTW